MPKYKNWDKKNEKPPEWRFSRELLIEGVLTEVSVIVYRQGGGIDDWWAELYFSNADVEEKSDPIDVNGKVSHYASSADSMTEAEEKARKFLRNNQHPSDVRSQANVEALGDLKEKVEEKARKNKSNFSDSHADTQEEAWNIVESVLMDNGVDPSKVGEGEIENLEIAAVEAATER